ncbi:unnamed protein product [Malus baccata var. baccata]
MINKEFLLLFRRLQNLTPFKPTTILQPRRTFCAKSPANANNGNVPETSVSSYHEQYKQLEKLDFMTATKMLFTALPSKIKFGYCFASNFLLLDFHLVQLFFCCLPSLAVCLVAQYARYEITRMEAELEKKKKKEAAKAKDELNATDGKKKAGSVPELLEEIVVESKTQTTSRLTRDHKGSSGKKNVVTWATNTSSSDSSKPSEKDHFGKQGSGNQDRLGKERVNGWHPVPYTSLKDKQGKIER